MRLIGPTGVKKIADAMRATFADDVRIRIADENVIETATQIDAHEFGNDGTVYDEGGVKVTMFEVDHGRLIKPAVGYRVDYAGHSVLLSGDTRFNENLIEHGMGVDLLLHEVCMLPEGLKSNTFFMAVMDHHTSPEECGIVFTRTKAKLAAFTHIATPGTVKDPPVSVDAIVEAARKTYQGPMTAGVDLMRFVIGSEIKTMIWDVQLRGYPA